MLPSVLLAALGLLGAFDIVYFHHYKCRLTARPESRWEVVTHVVRGFFYSAQFALVPNLFLGGAWYFAAILFFVIDAAVALTDVALEPKSRASQGGLPPGEYLMHIVLSLIVGGYITAWFSRTWHWMDEPTALGWAPDEAVPPFLRVALLAMSGVSALVAIVEGLLAIAGWLRRRTPVHVRIRLDADVSEVWSRTQDHVLHPTWDHRFSRIVMLDDEIRTGTSMRYEKRIAGIVISGTGRYQLHRPMSQSTFAFASAHPLSLIRRGVGLWLYRAAPTGGVELSTSYDYEVRYRIAGRLVDRFFFRPWIQRETERSFARLGALYFPGRHSAVLGRSSRRKPARFEGLPSVPKHPYAAFSVAPR